MPRTIQTICRLLLGAIFTVFGLNGFLQFMATPAVPPEAQQFLAGLSAAKYFWVLEKTIEVAGGVLLLTNFAAPFAILLLAPIVGNIFLFHAFLAPSGLVFAAIVLALEVALLLTYWPSFAPMFERIPSLKRSVRLFNQHGDHTQAA